MKLLIEPERFKRLLNIVLIYKGKPLLENVMGGFKPKGLMVKDCSLDVVAIQALFSEKFFLEYEATDENVPLTKTLLDPLNTGFKDEKIDVFTDEDHIVIKGKTETYNEPLIERDVGSIPFKMVIGEIGAVPEKLNPNVQVSLKAEDLNLPTAEKLGFSCDGETLKVSIKNIGEYTKTFKPTRKNVMNALDVAFDGAYFGAVVNNLDGEVWMSMNEGAVVFSQKTKDFVLTYLLSSIEE